MVAVPSRCTCVYAPFELFSCVHLNFQHFESLIRALPLEGVAIKYNICNIEPYQNHNANIGQCPTGPQHSHVTFHESLRCFAYDFYCNTGVSIVELLQSLCELVFFAAHLFQQCFHHMFCNLLHHRCLPLSKLLKLMIFFLR